MITVNKEAGLEKKQAIEKAVDEAIKENLLEGFFKIHRAEVIGMCLTEFDEEEAKRIWRKDGFAEGKVEGKNEGRSEKAVEAARNFYANGVSIEIIAKSLNMTKEQVRELVKESVSVKA